MVLFDTRPVGCDTAGICRYRGSVEGSTGWYMVHCLQKGPYFKDLVLNKDLFGILGPYWVLIYISGSLFSLFWFHSRKECQFSLHVYNNELF